MKQVIEKAAQAISGADALFVGAGAGIGVDSGLPDFRGNKGFWKAYPPFKKLGFSFVDMANPEWFSRDAELAWGFYGHRLHLYRDTTPHSGFDILRRWSEQKDRGGRVFTSNVDGQFQRARFAEGHIVECHGSIHHLQCAGPCTDAIWSAESVVVDVDLETFRARPPLPQCGQCGKTARPNILMFGDWAWHSSRTHGQQQSLSQWFSELAGAVLAVVELGAGTSVPTVRHTCERVANGFGAPLIRINPREPNGPSGTLSLALGAREALEAIDRLI